MVELQYLKTFLKKDARKLLLQCLLYFQLLSVGCSVKGIVRIIDIKPFATAGLWYF